MVSDRATDGLPYSVAPFLKQESSAQYHAAADRRRPLSEFGVAEFDGYRRHAAAAKADEQFFEARHNGTDGNAVILPFSPVTHGESRGAQSRNGREVSIPIASKPRPAASEKLREKANANVNTNTQTAPTNTNTTVKPTATPATNTAVPPIVKPVVTPTKSKPGATPKPANSQPPAATDKRPASGKEQDTQ